MGTIDDLYVHLRVLASQDCWPDDPDFCPCDYSGGNFDDAYEGGRETGKTMLARQLLKDFWGEMGP